MDVDLPPGYPELPAGNALVPCAPPSCSPARKDLLTPLTYRQPSIRITFPWAGSLKLQQCMQAEGIIVQAKLPTDAAIQQD